MGYCLLSKILPVIVWAFIVTIVINIHEIERINLFVIAYSFRNLIPQTILIPVTPSNTIQTNYLNTTPPGFPRSP